MRDCSMQWLRQCAILPACLCHAPQPGLQLNHSVLGVVSCSTSGYLACAAACARVCCRWPMWLVLKGRAAQCQPWPWPLRWWAAFLAEWEEHLLTQTGLCHHHSTHGKRPASWGRIAFSASSVRRWVSNSPLQGPQVPLRRPVAQLQLCSSPSPMGHGTEAALRVSMRRS